MSSASAIRQNRSHKFFAGGPDTAHLKDIDLSRNAAGIESGILFLVFGDKQINRLLNILSGRN
jgi:hypothetical protein